MAFLHLTGTPLAATQADLTPVQMAFLDEALPHVWLLLHPMPGESPAAGSTPGGDNAEQELRRRVKARRKGA